MPATCSTLLPREAPRRQRPRLPGIHTTQIKALADLDPLVLFSGDAFNPSLLSTATMGKQMVGGRPSPERGPRRLGCAARGLRRRGLGLQSGLQRPE